MLQITDQKLMLHLGTQLALIGVHLELSVIPFLITIGFLINFASFLLLIVTCSIMRLSLTTWLARSQLRQESSISDIFQGGQQEANYTNTKLALNYIKYYRLLASDSVKFGGYVSMYQSRFTTFMHITRRHILGVSK
jgi:hypothetical protein